MADPKPIHPDIPTTTAWQEGRRIYVPADYGSALGDALYRLGSTWDAIKRARWVGSTKKVQVIELLTVGIKPTPIHADIPLDKAWTAGGKLYVRCGQYSTLSAQLHDLGATWSKAERALRLGVSDTDRVVPLVLAAAARAARIEQVKALGLWLELPFEGAAHLRELAKNADAVYDKPRNAWAFPDEESFRRVRETRDRWVTQTAEEARLEEVERQRVEADRQARQETDRRQRLIEQSGRTVTGDTAELREISTEFMNRHTAAERTRTLGSLVRLSDGRRGVIVASKIWFTNSEFASSTCWHSETHDEAHWDFAYEVAIVEPTQDELDADAAKQAKSADARAIHELMRHADDLTGARADSWSVIPDDQRAAVITATTGVAAVIDAGRLILTRDDQVCWQHPGYYDDYVRREGISTDPELVARVRALVAAGDRTRVFPGQLPIYYKVQVLE